MPGGTLSQTLRHDGTNWVASSLLTNNGNDGAKLEKADEVWLSLRNSNTASGGRDWKLVSAGTSGGIGVGKFSVYDATSGLSRLAIDSGGNVGIGTAAPTQKLEVSGVALFTGGAGGGTFGIGGPASVNRVHTYAADPTIRFLSASNS